MNKKLGSQKSEMQDLVAENRKLKNDLQLAFVRIDEHEKRSEDREQYSRRNILRFHFVHSLTPIITLTRSTKQCSNLHRTLYYTILLTMIPEHMSIISVR